jgi:large subunit ribosomal protein L31
MKIGIHPNYVISQVSCACGSTFTTRSTRPVIKVEICSSCHPFYTGRQRLVDTAGRVDRFKKRFAKTEGQMIVRKKAEIKIKKLATVTSRKKVLSTTPTVKKDKSEKTPKK